MSGCDFRVIQRRFAEAIRTQTDYAPPECGLPVASRRMRVYQALFLNNVSQFFASIYPVCHEVLGRERWDALMRAFLRHHGARTPYFHFLGREFLDFLQGEAYVPHNDPPWLLALADWEWQELAVSVDEAEAPEPVEPSLDQVTTLSPLARLCVYDWPVHRVAPGEPLPRQETFLLIWRDGDYEVHFAQLAPLMAALLNSLDGEQPLAALFAQLSEACGQPVEALWSMAQPFLRDLGARGAIATSRSA